MTGALVADECCTDMIGVLVVVTVSINRVSFENYIIGLPIHTLAKLWTSANMLRAPLST
jgi:hypothetical protein